MLVLYVLRSCTYKSQVGRQEASNIVENLFRQQLGSKLFCRSSLRKASGAYVIAWMITSIKGSVVAPPWGDSKKNPCFLKPNGWQLLYWPQNGQCYRIFQKGYPCPETMEVTPNKDGIAECNCPPGTAQNPRDAVCYKLYTQGPCEENEFFGPVTKVTASMQSRRWGSCFELEDCGNNQVFWPKDNKCYNKNTKGPCPEGLLLSNNSAVGECACNNETMYQYYYEEGLSCHEHFTQGPCQTGLIFLPGGKCGCNPNLKQYDPDNGLCFALDSQGPCRRGQIYQIGTEKANVRRIELTKCYCREGYKYWDQDKSCYLPFTRGPCAPGEMLNILNSTEENNLTCTPIPCPIGNLYLQEDGGCHKVGAQGPCPNGQVVLYKNQNHNSIDGISYAGQCGCEYIQSENFFYKTLAHSGENSNVNCSQLTQDGNNSIKLNAEAGSNTDKICGTSRGRVLYEDKQCWQLYTQGPCKEGEWLVPDRGRGQREGRGWRFGKCECRPGFTTVFSSDSTTICQYSVYRYLPDKQNN